MADRTTEIIDAIDELVDWQLSLREGGERQGSRETVVGPGGWVRRLLLVGPQKAADFLLIDVSPWEVAIVRGRYAKRVRNG